MSIQEDNKAAYRQFVAQINTGNFDGLERFYTADYVEHNAPPGVPPTVETIKMVFGMFRRGFPDVRFEIEDLVAEGDRLATYVRGTGTHQGEFMGIPPTGRHASWVAFGINRYVDGKMAEHWGLPDVMGIMNQLGAGGPPRGEAEVAHATSHAG